MDVTWDVPLLHTRTLEYWAAGQGRGLLMVMVCPKIHVVRAVTVRLRDVQNGPGAMEENDKPEDERQTTELVLTLHVSVDER